METNPLKIFLPILLMALLPLASKAAVIPGIYNTGTHNEFISGGVQIDKDYTFRKVSGDNVGYFGHGRVAIGDGYPVGVAPSSFGKPWLADTVGSHWLTPSANRAASYDATSNGIYHWVLKFDLTGYLANTAEFTGRFAADNNAKAYLNGHLIGTAKSYSKWYSLASAKGDFVDGLNVLKFVVINTQKANNNPTGLRVQFLSSNVLAAPIPAAVWLFGSALLGLTASRKRKKN